MSPPKNNAISEGEYKYKEISILKKIFSWLLLELPRTINKATPVMKVVLFLMCIFVVTAGLTLYSPNLFGLLEPPETVANKLGIDEPSLKYLAIAMYFCISFIVLYVFFSNASENNPMPNNADNKNMGVKA